MISVSDIGTDEREGYFGEISTTEYRDFFRKIFQIKKVPQDFKIPYPHHATIGDTYGDWFFNHHFITPIGFLIFKPFNPRYLDGYI